MNFLYIFNIIKNMMYNFVRCMSNNNAKSQSPDVLL